MSTPIDRFVQAFATTTQQLAIDKLSLQLPPCVEFLSDDTTDDIVVVEGHQGKSLKSANAFLNWKTFVKTVSGMTIDGFAGFTIPCLMLPVAIKMMIDARELVTQQLRPSHTALILALHKSGKGQVAEASVDELVNSVTAEAPFTETTVSVDSTCINDLIEWGCIRRNDDQTLELIELVEIKAP